MNEMICPCCGQYIDVSEIRADAIEECLQILKDNIEYIETDNEAYRTISIDAIQLFQQLKEQK